MKNKNLTKILIKYQLIFLSSIFSLLFIIIFSYTEIHFLLANSLFKSNEKNLIIQDYRSVILNISQFIPTQFSSIELIKNDKIIFSLGSEDHSFFYHAFNFHTKDHLTLIFYTNYFYIFLFVFFYLILSICASFYINFYFTNNYKIQIDKQMKLQKIEILSELAKKVAHDIRSPISTLNMLADLIENKDIKELQIAVIQKINQIAEELLSMSKNKNLNSKTNNENINDIFKQLEKEYKLKYKNIKFEFINNLQKEFFIENSILIYQNLNNFINNSIEAGSTTISLTLKINDSNLTISVKDNGHGIPKDILNKLGKEIYTTKNPSILKFNKSGNGIALLNAKKDLQKQGWKLQISSEVNIGTEILISIPMRE